jgi:hypothetical protein
MFESAPTELSEVDEAPPSPAEDATPIERFAQFRAWLGAGGIRYEVWQEDTALVAADGAILRIAFPSEFKRKLAAQMVDDARVRRGMQGCFPLCSRLELMDRGADLGNQTSREVKAQDARQRQSELEAAVDAHADVRAVREKLGATITAVHGTPDSPLPPPLDPEVQL